ncbi:MAG: NIPSNAP family protein [Actinomycetota bacterium]|nr:NIPSNAP family protein [Actinomycetota bacterium]
MMELRQYTLRPGRRDELITLFEREFVEPQERLGMHLAGMFRDVDDPNRFVWLRGFPDLAARPAALAEFYTGPVWREHRDAANATMIDSDDVLLLRSLRDLSTPPGPCPPAGSPAPNTQVGVTIHHFAAPPTDDVVAQVLAEPALAVYLTEPSENLFPALPVREGEHVLVTIGEPGERLPDSSREPDRLRLAPTGRSRLRQWCA